MVEATDSDETNAAAQVADTDLMTWTSGAQQLLAAVTLRDAFVGDEIVQTYRVFGTVAED